MHFDSFEASKLQVAKSELFFQSREHAFNRNAHPVVSIPFKGIAFHW